MRDEEQPITSGPAHSASELLDPAALAAFFALSFGFQWFWRGRTQHQLEPGLWTVGTFCMVIAAFTRHRYRTSCPVFMTIGAIYCSIVLLFALADARDAALVAYQRLSANAALISCIWGALGFTCGLEPGELKPKLLLWATIVCIMLLRLALMFSAVPEIDPAVLTPLGIREDAATEVVGSLLLTSSLQAHIITPTVGFVAGLRVLHMLTRLNNWGVEMSENRDELAHSLRSSRSQVLDLLRKLPVQRKPYRRPPRENTKVRFS